MHLILLISGVMSMWAAKPLLHSSGGRFLVKELAGAGQKKNAGCCVTANANKYVRYLFRSGPV
jgi:hypothetical protein